MSDPYGDELADLAENEQWFQDQQSVRESMLTNTRSDVFDETLRQYPDMSKDMTASLLMSGLNEMNPELANAVRNDYVQQSFVSRATNTLIGFATRPITGGFFSVWDTMVGQPQRMATDYYQQQDRYGSASLKDSYFASGLSIPGQITKAVREGDMSLRQVAMGTGLGDGLIAGNPASPMQQPGAGRHFENLLIEGMDVNDALEETARWVSDEYGAPVVNRAFEAADLTQLHVTYQGVDYGYGVSIGRLATTPLAMLNIIQPKSIPSNIISASLDGLSQIFLDPMDPFFFQLTKMMGVRFKVQPVGPSSPEDLIRATGGIELVPPSKASPGVTADGFAMVGGARAADAEKGLETGVVTTDLERALRDAKLQEAKEPGTGVVHILKRDHLPQAVQDQVNLGNDMTQFASEDYVYPLEQLHGVPERIIDTRSELDAARLAYDEVAEQIRTEYPEYGSALDEYNDWIENPDDWRYAGIDEVEIAQEINEKVAGLEAEYQKLNELLFERDEILKAVRGPQEVDPRLAEIDAEAEEILGKVFDPALRGSEAPPVESIHTGKPLQQLGDEIDDMDRLITETGDPDGAYTKNRQSLIEYRDRALWTGDAVRPGSEADKLLTNLRDNGLKLTPDEYREAEELIDQLWESKYADADLGNAADRLERLEELIGTFEARKVIAEDDLARMMGARELDETATITPIRPVDEMPNVIDEQFNISRGSIEDVLDDVPDDVERLMVDNEALTEEYRTMLEADEYTEAELLEIEGRLDAVGEDIYQRVKSLVDEQKSGIAREPGIGDELAGGHRETIDEYGHPRVKEIADGRLYESTDKAGNVTGAIRTYTNDEGKLVYESIVDFEGGGLTDAQRAEATKNTKEYMKAREQAAEARRVQRRTRAAEDAKAKMSDAERLQATTTQAEHNTELARQGQQVIDDESAKWQQRADEYAADDSMTVDQYYGSDETRTPQSEIPRLRVELERLAESDDLEAMRLLENEIKGWMDVSDEIQKGIDPAPAPSPTVDRPYLRDDPRFRRPPRRLRPTKQFGLFSDEEFVLLRQKEEAALSLIGKADENHVRNTIRVIEKKVAPERRYLKELQDHLAEQAVEHNYTERQLAKHQKSIDQKGFQRKIDIAERDIAVYQEFLDEFGGIDQEIAYRQTKGTQQVPGQQLLGQGGYEVPQATRNPLPGDQIPGREVPQLYAPETGLPSKVDDLEFRIKKLRRQVDDAERRYGHSATDAPDDPVGALMNEQYRLETEYRQLTGDDFVDPTGDYDPVYDKAVADAEKQGKPLVAEGPPSATATETFGAMPDRMFNEVWMGYRQLIDDFVAMGFPFENLTDAKQLLRELTGKTPTEVKQVIREGNFDKQALRKKLQDFVDNYGAANAERGFRDTVRRAADDTAKTVVPETPTRPGPRPGEEGIPWFQNGSRMPEGRFKIRVDTRGDSFGKQFSALNAKLRLPDGTYKKIEDIWQYDIKKSGKGQDPTDMSMDSEAIFTDLWRQWADQNPSKIAELDKRLGDDGLLWDSFENPGRVSQARSLARIIAERRGLIQAPEVAKAVDVTAPKVPKKKNAFPGAKEAQARADKFNAQADEIRIERKKLQAEFRRAKAAGEDTAAARAAVEANSSELQAAQDAGNAAMKELNEIMSAGARAPAEKAVDPVPVPEPPVEAAPFLEPPPQVAARYEELSKQGDDIEAILDQFLADGGDKAQYDDLVKQLGEIDAEASKITETYPQLDKILSGEDPQVPQQIGDLMDEAAARTELTPDEAAGAPPPPDSPEVIAERLGETEAQLEDLQDQLKAGDLGDDEIMEIEERILELTDESNRLEDAYNKVAPSLTDEEFINPASAGVKEELRAAFDKSILQDNYLIDQEKLIIEQLLADELGPEAELALRESLDAIAEEQKAISDFQMSYLKRLNEETAKERIGSLDPEDRPALITQRKEVQKERNAASQRIDKARTELKELPDSMEPAERALRKTQLMDQITVNELAVKTYQGELDYIDTAIRENSKIKRENYLAGVTEDPDAPKTVDTSLDEETIRVAQQRQKEIRAEIYQTKTPSVAPDPKIRPLTPDEALEAWASPELIGAHDAAQSRIVDAETGVTSVNTELGLMDARQQQSVAVYLQEAGLNESGTTIGSFPLQPAKTLSIADAEAMLDAGYLFPTGRRALNEALKFIEEGMDMTKSRGRFEAKDANTWLESNGRKFVDWLNDLKINDYVKIEKLLDAGVPEEDIMKMLANLKKHGESSYDSVKKWVNGQRITEQLKPTRGVRAQAIQMASRSRLVGSTKMPTAQRIIGDWGRRWMAVSSASRVDPWNFDITFKTIVNNLETIGTDPARIDELIFDAYEALGSYEKMRLVQGAMVVEVQEALIRKGYDPEYVVRAMEDYYAKLEKKTLFSIDIAGNPIADDLDQFEIRNTASGQRFTTSTQQALSDAEISMTYMHVMSVREARRATSGARKTINRWKESPVLFEPAIAQEMADLGFSVWRNMQLARIGWSTSVLPEEGLRMFAQGHSEILRNPLLLILLVATETGDTMPSGRSLETIAKAQGGLGVGFFGAGVSDDMPLGHRLGPRSSVWVAVDPLDANGNITRQGAKQIARVFAEEYNSVLTRMLWETGGDVYRVADELMNNPKSVLREMLQGGGTGATPGDKMWLGKIKKSRNKQERWNLMLENLEALNARNQLLTGGDYIRRNPKFKLLDGEPEFLNSGGGVVNTYDGMSGQMNAAGHPMPWTKQMLIEEIRKRDPVAGNLFSKDGTRVTIQDLRLRLMEMDGIPDPRSMPSNDNYLIFKNGNPDLLNLLGSGKLNGANLDDFTIRRSAVERMVVEFGLDSGIPDGNQMYVTMTRQADGTMRVRFSTWAEGIDVIATPGMQSLRIIDTSKLEPADFLKIQGEYVGKGEVDMTVDMERILNTTSETSPELQALMDKYNIEDLDEIDELDIEPFGEFMAQMKRDRAGGNEISGELLEERIQERMALGEVEMIHGEMTVESIDRLTQYVEKSAYGTEFPPPARIKAPAGDEIPRGNVEALNDLVSDIFMAIGQKPSEFLNRNPYSKIRAWETAADFYLHATPEIRRGLEDGAVVAGFTRTQFQRIVKRSLRLNGMDELPRLPAAVQLSIGEIEEIMLARAVKDTRDLFFDLSERGNWADALKLVFPFGDAWWEVLSRWAKLMNPMKADEFGKPFRNLRRAQQGTMAGERSGWFEENSQGERVFSFFPGPAWLTSITANIPAGVNMKDVVPLGKFGFIDFSDTRSVTGPGTSPLIQGGAALFRPLYEDYPPVMNVINAMVYGGFNPSTLEDGFMGYFAPSWARNFGNAINSGEHDLNYASMQIDFVNALIASDPKYANIGTDVDLLYEVTKEAQEITAHYAFIETFTSSVYPVQAQLDIEAVRMGSRGTEMIMPASVANDFAFLTEYMGRDAALEWVVAAYGTDPLNILRKSYMVRSRPMTETSFNFMNQHPDADTFLPFTVAAFMPPEVGGAFYQEEFQRQVSDGDRARMTLRQSIQVLSYGQGNTRFAKVKDERDAGLYEAEVIWGRDSEMYKRYLKDTVQPWYNDAKRSIEATAFGWTSGSVGPDGVPKRGTFQQFRDEMLQAGTSGTPTNLYARRMNPGLTNVLTDISQWWIENDTASINMGHEAQWWYSGSARSDFATAAMRSEFLSRVSRRIESIDDTDVQQQANWYVQYIVQPLMSGYGLENPVIISIDPLVLPEG